MRKKIINKETFEIIFKTFFKIRNQVLTSHFFQSGQEKELKELAFKKIVAR